MSQNYTVLIVDDDLVTCTTLRGYFEQAGYRVQEAYDCGGARQILQSQPVELILLDVGLPDEDGFNLMREIRRDSDLPVIFVTSHIGDIDRIVGLELGADDYIIKPFNARELVVRVKNLLRRTYDSRPTTATARKNFNGWTLELQRRRLLAPDGSDVMLTRAEFDLLAALVANAGRAMSRDALLNHISQRDWTPVDRTVDVLVGRLRHKLGDNPKTPELIVTLHGVGYLFAARVNSV
ncbi:MAG: response regulator [Candidatus Competibacteraceae bacterium]|nr:response regulator [Candidatus Competibacteraceae bacterium]MCB1807245.1 response regulator [Candidatus Competibacteraceae bacterium]MCB1813476.1 response regulator [Candidatus Competibacteraceae bacterium]